MGPRRACRKALGTQHRCCKVLLRGTGRRCYAGGEEWLGCAPRRQDPAPFEPAVSDGEAGQKNWGRKSIAKPPG